MYKRYLYTAFLIFLIWPQVCPAKSSCFEVFDISSIWEKRFFQHYNPWDYSKHPVTLGAEVEGLVPIKAWIGGAAKAVFKKVKKKYPDSTYKTTTSDIRISYYKNNKEYIYSIGSDISIVNRDKLAGVEIRSPILRDKEDVDFFLQVIKETVKQADLTAEPSSAGVHIHVGFPEATAHELALLLKIYSNIETQLYRTFAVSAYRKIFAGLTSNTARAFLQNDNKPIGSIEELLKKVETEFRGLNLLAYNKFKTTEFKFINSTVDTRLIEEAFNFSEKLVRAVREKDPRLVNFLNKYRDHEELPMDELMQALEIDLSRTKKLLRKVQRKQRLELWKQQILQPALIPHIFSTSIIVFQYLK